jgi:hypothetical protein
MTHIAVQGIQIQWLVVLTPFTGAILWPAVRFLLAKLKQ